MGIDDRVLFTAQLVADTLKPFFPSVSQNIMYGKCMPYCVELGDGLMAVALDFTRITSYNYEVYMVESKRSLYEAELSGLFDKDLKKC